MQLWIFFLKLKHLHFSKNNCENGNIHSNKKGKGILVGAHARGRVHAHHRTRMRTWAPEEALLFFSAPQLKHIISLLFAEPTLVLTAWISLRILPFPCCMRNSWPQLKRPAPLDLSELGGGCSAPGGRTGGVRSPPPPEEWRSGSLRPTLPGEQTACCSWGTQARVCWGAGCECPWKHWGELGARGTTQQSFNQQFLTAKPFPRVMYVSR